MKRHNLLLCLLLCVAQIVMAQTEKKPTLMILPSDHWCSARYFTTNFDNFGKTIVINDFQSAFREDAELSMVVSKIGELMANYGYMVKDYSQEMAAINDRQVENEVTMSKMGSMISETPLDMLRRRAKYDIELRIDWDVNKDVVGKKKVDGKSVSFTLQAIDTYTSKVVATSSGVSDASTEIVPRILESAVAANMENFNEQLTRYFENLQKNGREITFIVQTWDSGMMDLEEEFDGDELIDVIQDWMYENTVNGVFNLSDATETRALFEQVRIPFFNEKGRAMDARSFATQLRKYLANTYMIESKVMTRGLGEVILVLGEK